tara:strand:- start:3718 stop:3963 length:246 start_codon:yes stop_codon:yes gene_type:complete
MEKGNICGVAQLYVCPKYEEGQEPDVRVISVELFVSLYNNGELPDPEYLIVTTSLKDMAESIYGDRDVTIDTKPLNMEIWK